MSAKDYTLTLLHATKVGETQLKPGEYRMTLKGDSSVITSMETKRSVTVPVKLETADKPFHSTMMAVGREGDVDVLREVELGGTKITVKFGE